MGVFLSAIMFALSDNLGKLCSRSNSYIEWCLETSLLYISLGNFGDYGIFQEFKSYNYIKKSKQKIFIKNLSKIKENSI